MLRLVHFLDIIHLLWASQSKDLSPQQGWVHGCHQVIASWAEIFDKTIEDHSDNYCCQLKRRQTTFSLLEIFLFGLAVFIIPFVSSFSHSDLFLSLCAHSEC